MAVLAVLAVWLKYTSMLINDFANVQMHVLANLTVILYYVRSNEPLFYQCNTCTVLVGFIHCCKHAVLHVLVHASEHRQNHF